MTNTLNTHQHPESSRIESLKREFHHNMLPALSLLSAQIGVWMHAALHKESYSPGGAMLTMSALLATHAVSTTLFNAAMNIRKEIQQLEEMPIVEPATVLVDVTPETVTVDTNYAKVRNDRNDAVDQVFTNEDVTQGVI